MSNMLRFGVIGAGAFASRRHIPDILRNENATLTALCRRDAETLKRLSDHFGPERTYTDWRRMLDECPLDAVVIATPNNLHFEQAKAALERGLHVLIEKPMTARAEEARELQKLAEAHDLRLAVAFNPPYWAHCHAMRRALHGGHLGEVESASFYWAGNSGVVFGDKPMPEDMPGPVHPTLFRADPSQCGGGCFMDGGAHLVSEVLWVTGLRATQVACLMDRTPSDRRTALSMTLENGVVATLSSIADSQGASRRVRNTIGCSRGTITVDGFDFRTTIMPDGGEPETFCEADLPPVPGPVADLVDSILHQTPLLSDVGHGVHVQEVLEGLYASAASGSAVTL
jgi:predicted dehydrogenase